MIIKIPCQNLNLKVGDKVETKDGNIHKIEYISSSHSSMHYVHTTICIVYWYNDIRYISMDDRINRSYIYKMLFDGTKTIIRKL